MNRTELLESLRIIMEHADFTDKDIISFDCPICNKTATVKICDYDSVNRPESGVKTLMYKCENGVRGGCTNVRISQALADKWNRTQKQQKSVGEWRKINGEPLTQRTEEELKTERNKNNNIIEINVESDDIPYIEPKKRIKKATEFKDIDHEFLWDPYLPIGNFTVLMAAGGTGKSVLTCGIAAAITQGKRLYGMKEQPKPKNVLFISAEDSGEDYRSRLKASGADLNRVSIVDKDDSIGLEYLDGDFEEIIKETQPALVIIDPWHAFAGDIDINRINIVRPLYQRLDRMAAKYHCAMILVSHVNKKAQDGNANNAAVGSVDFINASRSALQVIFDTEDDDQRIMVHTKINHRRFGESLKYRIIKDGGLEWVGTSPVTRFTLEEAAAKRKKPTEIIAEIDAQMKTRTMLLEAVLDIVGQSDKREVNVAYQQFLDDYGPDIFGGRSRPSKCFEDIELDLFNAKIKYQTSPVLYKGQSKSGIKFIKTQTTFEAFEDTYKQKNIGEN